MDEAFLGYRFLLLLFIVALNAFFACAEMALVSARQTRLRELAAEGNVGATSALSLLDHPERLLSTVQVGVTLASLGAGWAGEESVFQLLLMLFQPILPPDFLPAIRIASFIISFLVLTYVMVVLGEVVPKNVGIKNAEWLATTVAPVLLVFQRISDPFVRVLEKSAAGVSRLFGVGGESRGGTHSVEELRLIAGSIRVSGRIAHFEEAALNRVLDLPGIAVRQVMVPRNDIVSVSVEASLDHVLRTFAESLYTRLPVYEGEPERIIGLVHYKDLIPVWYRSRTARRLNQPPPPFRLRSILRRHLVVPESKPLSQMVDDFRQSHAHMAMVVDEFGTIVGLVTIEDVFEQIFGEIEDEHDVRRPRPTLQAAVLELEGTVSIRDLDTQYGIELPVNAGFETLAGYLLFRLGRIPKAGEVVADDGRRFTILEMEHHRIARVKFERIEEAVSTEGSESQPPERG
jgi:CBS domain containing-hemolysin-like protein